MLINLRNALMAGGSEPAPAYWGLCFTAEEAGSTVALTKTGSPPAVTLETSRDGLVWMPYAIGDTITLANVGDKVFFAAGESGNSQMASSDLDVHRFMLRGKLSASGDITSLLERHNTLSPTTSRYHVFAGLFEDCTALTTPPKLGLHTVVQYCYYHTFSNCTNLTVAPEISAVNLASYGFYQMFNGCSSLTVAPELPNRNLVTHCYRGMFYGCTGLTTAPELPATTLAASCYRDMFFGCTALTTAPELPATTLATACYRDMFSGCTSLTSIKVHFTAWGTQTNNWMNGVAASGVFKCPDALPHTESYFSATRIPPGWTVETF